MNYIKINFKLYCSGFPFSHTAIVRVYTCRYNLTRISSNWRLKCHFTVNGNFCLMLAARLVLYCTSEWSLWRWSRILTRAQTRPPSAVSFLVNIQRTELKAPISGGPAHATVILPPSTPSSNIQDNPFPV